jgi:hypothetical protein
MKSFLILILSLATIKLLAIDRFVDPNLSSANGVNYFNSINSAVGASSNGDKIFIVSGTYNEAVLNISKSITLISQSAGGVIDFNSNINITGFPGMKLEIIGFNLGIYSVTANAITNGVANNRAKVSFIDCQMTNLNFNQNYYVLNVVKSNFSNDVIYRFGNFVISKTNNLYVYDEPNANLSGEKIFIVADTVVNRLEIRNDDYPFVIANCLLKNLFLYKWNHDILKTNFIRNNSFNNPYLQVSHNPPAYNFEFSSNEFIGTVNFAYSAPNCGGFSGSYDYRDCNDCGQCIGFSTGVSYFPNPNSVGFFKWVYNGIDLPSTIPNASNPLVLTKIIGNTATNINSGDPNHEYYDLDLTINDRGRMGGPYSISNYFPSVNPSNGKAFIFDLDIPADIFSGQSINVKASGYQKNR